MSSRSEPRQGRQGLVWTDHAAAQLNAAVPQPITRLEGRPEGPGTTNQRF